MNIKGLPPKIQQMIGSLTREQEFQNIFATDPVLDELETQKINQSDELLYLRAIHNLKLEVNNLLFNNLTINKWVLLWCLNNRLCLGKNDVQPFDIDVFIYVLENDITNLDTKLIISNATNYCLTHGLDYQKILHCLLQIIKISFYPLSYLPKQNCTNELETIPVYDVEWATSIASKIYRQTGKNIDYILNNMSLTAVCYFYVEWFKENSPTKCQRMTSELIIQKMDERASELCIDYLVSKQMFSKEEGAQYLKILKELPNK